MLFLGGKLMYANFCIHLGWWNSIFHGPISIPQEEKNQEACDDDDGGR